MPIAFDHRSGIPFSCRWGFGTGRQQAFNLVLRSFLLQTAKNWLTRERLYQKKRALAQGRPCVFFSTSEKLPLGLYSMVASLIAKHQLLDEVRTHIRWGFPVVACHSGSLLHRVDCNWYQPIHDCLPQVRLHANSACAYNMSDELYQWTSRFTIDYYYVRPNLSAGFRVRSLHALHAPPHYSCTL